MKIDAVLPVVGQAALPSACKERVVAGILTSFSPAPDRRGDRGVKETRRKVYPLHHASVPRRL